MTWFGEADVCSLALLLDSLLRLKITAKTEKTMNISEIGLLRNSIGPASGNIKEERKFLSMIGPKIKVIATARIENPPFWQRYPKKPKIIEIRK